MALRYAKVSVPAHLMERLAAIISSRPELGYRSASDAVTECLRSRVEELSHVAAIAYERSPALEGGEGDLWIPACPDCGTERRDLVFLPGDENGPVSRERLHGHWTCVTCGQRNSLPKSEWRRHE